MKNSPRYKDDSDSQNLLPSPSSSCIRTVTRPVTTRSGSKSPYQTTVIETDKSSFKQVVQMFTGIPEKPNYLNPTVQPDPRYPPSFHSIPPIKAVPNKKQFRLYERRNSMKHHHLMINPTHSGLPEIISPSILDFPSLALSPVTPLVADPFYGAGSSNQSPCGPGFGYYARKLSSDVEEKANKEKGFYLLPSPPKTPRDPKPQLLSLFPVTSPSNSKP